MAPELITVTFTPAPTGPSRDDPDNFRTEADAWVSWQEVSNVPEMTAFVPEANALSTQVNLDAATAASASQSASASANFLGEWDDLTGAATVPTSVAHDGYVWLLLADMADITSEEPSETATNWQLIRNNFMARSERTSNTALAFSDHGNFIDITSGTFTQTIAAISTLLSGLYCYVRNSGAGVITIDPNGSETIDGELTGSLGPGENRIIQSNGTNFKSILIPVPVKKLLQTVTASAASSVEFTDFINDDLYTDYLIKSDDVSATGATVSVQVGTGGTPTWQTGATYDYNISMLAANLAAPTYTTEINQTDIKLSALSGIYAGIVNNLTITVVSPSSAKPTYLTYTTYGADTYAKITECMGVFRTTTPVTALKIFHASYTLTGTFKLYGIK